MLSTGIENSEDLSLNNFKIIPHKEIKIEEKIGTGATAEVFKGKKKKINTLQEDQNTIFKNPKISFPWRNNVHIISFFHYI